ncbi:2,3-diketo-5-methylthio-1-phosphopentane phosphatase, partial [Bacillaceae bacterium HSR45]|nr:2,3-diketo-5-methylthio-1-phosphopentane phosphatase [Bacillaceae bacterium HSR45]
MKKWAFVSDFDGTISKQDFYWMVIDKYFPEGRELFKKWKSGELKDIEFLGTVFASINQSEQKIIDDIHSFF